MVGGGVSCVGAGFLRLGPFWLVVDIFFWIWVAACSVWTFATM